MQRVKVYRIIDDSLQWEDIGTGFIKLDYLEQSQEIGIVVIDEDDKETLLVHRISKDIIYNIEDGTIITWRDPEDESKRMGLSFQEAVGCTNIWNHICSTIRIEQFNALHGEVGETFHNVSSELKFPDVNLDNLPQILEIVTENNQMQVTELMLKDPEFFHKLVHVFERCEEMKNVVGLHMMFNIVKAVFSLNNSQILEIILGDQLIMKIIGCLEYDPDVPQSQHHRNYLRDHVAFKEPIPIKDPLVLSKIHQIYRIGYLKDAFWTKERCFDDIDETSAALDSVINASMATIATQLKNDSNFIQALFASLRSPSTSVESSNNLAHFLLEFCRLSKSLNWAQKELFIEELTSKGIFVVIAQVLQDPDKKLVLTGTEILSTLFTNDDSLLRSVSVQPGSPIFDLLVKGLMEDFGDKMKYQFIDIIRNILESRGVERIGSFYGKYIPELINCITASCPESPGNASEGASTRVGSHHGAQAEVLLTICDLLSFCVVMDSSRRNFLHKNLTEKVLVLTRRKEKHVVAAAIRFLRTLLAVHDDDVQSDIIENNVLKPVIDVFVANGHGDNMLFSTILELLEHISKGNEPVLLKYVIDTFWDQLASFEHLPSIQSFKLRYDQCAENMETTSTTDPAENSASASETKKEEDKPQGSTSSDSPSKTNRGLVDYDDDDKDCGEAGDDKKCGEAGNEECHSKRPRHSPTSEGNKNSP